MNVIFKLSLNNIRKYLREALLVVLSITLTISMMTMIALVMSSLYGSYVSYNNRYNQVNASIYGITNIPSVLDDISRDNLLAYSINGDNNVIFDEDESLYIYPHAYGKCENNVIESWCLRNEIIEGRRSNNINEIVVHRDSSLQVGDKLNLLVGNYEETKNIEVVVVGRNNSVYHNDYYLSEDEMTTSVYWLDLVFKDSSKHIDKQLKNILKTNENFTENKFIELNDDYNYFLKMQSKPGPMLYAFMITTLIMLILVGLATFTLILNAFESLLAQKLKTLGTLRSIGMTKKQMRQMIVYEGTILTGFGLAGGILIGSFLAKVLINFVNKTIKDILLALQSASQFDIIFYNYKLIYILIIVVGFLVVLFAQLNKTREIFKYSSIETIRQNKIVNNKFKRNLSIKPIKSLAVINTKMTNSYQGIKRALTITLILLIGINGWIFSLANTPLKGENNKYDTTVTLYSRELSEVDDDKNKLVEILNKYDEIEEINIVRDLSSFSFAESVKKGSIFQQNSSFYEANFDEFPIRLIALEDSEFTKLVKSEKMSSTIQSIFINHTEFYLDGDKISGSIIDITDGQKVQINHHSDVDNLEFIIDTVVDKFSVNNTYLSNAGPVIVISEAFYQKYLVNNLDTYYTNILIKSSLSIKQLNTISDEFDQLQLNNIAYLNSDYYDSYVSLILSKTIFIITSLIFVYIGIVIIINIVNISISAYQNRKQDLAILMSVGASKKQLEKMFLWESLFIVIKPYILGVFLGHLISFTIVKITSILIDEKINYVVNYSVMAISIILVIMIIFIQYFAIKSENKKLDLINDIRSY